MRVNVIGVTCRKYTRHQIYLFVVSLLKIAHELPVVHEIIIFSVFALLIAPPPTDYLPTNSSFIEYYVV